MQHFNTLGAGMTDSVLIIDGNICGVSFNIVSNHQELYCWLRVSNNYLAHVVDVMMIILHTSAVLWV